MKKTCYLIIVLTLFACQKKSVKENTKETPVDTTTTTTSTVEGPGIVFGYANEQGNALLVDSIAQEDSLESVVVPGDLIFTIDTGGKLIRIKYEQFKPATKQDTHRDIYFNFENASGHLFNIDFGMTDPGLTSVLLSKKFMDDHTLLELTKPLKQALPDSIKKKVTADKNRKVKSFYRLVDFDSTRSLYLVEFTKVKDSVLVSLVLTGGTSFIYHDFPAMYNEQSTWRVDDGGEFGFEYFKILAVFMSNGKLQVITDWVGAEGYNTLYLEEDGGRFKVLKEHYRYTAPI